MENEKKVGMVEVKRLVKELNGFLKADDFSSIYQLCESIMITIDEADLEGLY